MSDKSSSMKVLFLRPRAAVNRLQDGRVRVVLEMPGVSHEGLDVKVENSELRIIGRRDKGREGKHILRERGQGDFLMTYTLDETVDASKIDAVLEKGILTLTLDVKEEVKPRTIQVRPG